MHLFLTWLIIVNLKQFVPTTAPRTTSDPGGFMYRSSKKLVSETIFLKCTLLQYSTKFNILVQLLTISKRLRNTTNIDRMVHLIFYSQVFSAFLWNSSLCNDLWHSDVPPHLAQHFFVGSDLGLIARWGWGLCQLGSFILSPCNIFYELEIQAMNY